MSSLGDSDEPDFDWDDFVARSMELSPEEALINAWRAADPTTPGGRLTREALALSAQEFPGMQGLLNELVGIQDRLEFSLDGPGVVDHSASAEKMGTFLKSVSRAIRDLAKSRTGRQRIRDNILTTALAQGSVLVAFEVRPEPRPVGSLAKSATDRIENFAMRDLASLLLNAEDQESDVLDASVRELRGHARRSLRAVAKVVAEAGWEVTGELKRSDGDRVPLQLSQFGAHRILDSTARSDQEVTVIRRSGVVDTWSWSKQTMKLELPDGSTIDAYVPPTLAQRVAELNAEHETVVLVVLEQLITYPKGDKGSKRESHTLRSIEQEPVQTSIGGE